MLHLSLLFFIIAIIAAIFGFGGVASGAVEVARLLFFVFIALFVLSMLAGMFQRGKGA